MNQTPIDPLLPEWVEPMKRGRWYRISGDNPDLGLPPTALGTRFLRDTDPGLDKKLNPAKSIKERLRRVRGRRPHSPWQGKSGFHAITEAWNGAVYASQFRPSGSMIIFGGGHDDYFGSSVHVFDLATREWSRLSDGYVSGPDSEYGPGALYPASVYPDGSPLPPHTYGYVQYDPVGNDYVLCKGQIELGPNVKSVPIPHMFNLVSLTWRHGPRHPSAILGSGGFSTWDETRRILWGHSGDSGNALIGFGPDGENSDGTFGSWTKHYPKKIPNKADHNAMCIDPARDVIVATDHAANRLVAIDPKEPSREIVKLTSAGESPGISPYAALEYAANLDSLIYYSANDSPHVYALTPAAGYDRPQLVRSNWMWRRLLSDGNTLDPIADAAAISSFPVNKEHIFGRFRIATFGQTTVAILVRHTDTPVYAMKV
jgi:hypothetical protein